jgi:hypothetical protein
LIPYKIKIKKTRTTTTTTTKYTTVITFYHNKKCFDFFGFFSYHHHHQHTKILDIKKQTSKNPLPNKFFNPPKLFVAKLKI